MFLNPVTLAVLTVPRLFRSTNRWIGPLHSILRGDDVRRVTIPVQIHDHYEQIVNIAFEKSSAEVYIIDLGSGAVTDVFRYAPAITPSTNLVHRLEIQLKGDPLWRPITRLDETDRSFPAAAL